MTRPAELAMTHPRPGKLSSLQQLPAANGKQSVLVVDDCRSVRELLCSFLDQVGGFQIESAGTLAEVRELIAANPERFFCAALDLNLPDAPDGEVVDIVAARGIPVVVLTGTVNEGTRQAMLAKQIVDYVIKRNANEVEHVAYVIGRLRENRAKKVLIVDDSRAFRLFLESLLKKYCYQTLQAGNGREALVLLKEHPDTTLVITDVNMPEMGGLDLISAIRSQYRRQDLAIIGLSDASKPGLSALLLKLGANDFLAKPFEVEEFYCRVTQNTNMIGYVRQIRDSSIRDFLTGTYNRRHLFEVGETLYANARRGNIHIATAIIDADHFKQINDTFGHHTGDDVLKSLAATIQAAVRKTDIVARYGGEEFVCMAVVKEPGDASVVFERLRAAVEALEPRAGGNRVPITVSIGVTTDLCDNLESMLKRADEYLYKAKQSGRNRVVLL